MCETEREREMGGRETHREERKTEGEERETNRQTDRHTDRGRQRQRNREREGKRQRQRKRSQRERDRDTERAAIAREKEGGRESEKKTCSAHIRLQNVQDVAWNETSHPKSIHVYLLSHQTTPAIQSNKDIHNTQSNHIFTQSLYLKSYFTQLTEIRAAVASKSTQSNTEIQFRAD